MGENVKNFYVGGYSVTLKPSNAGSAGFFVWLTGIYWGEVFRGAGGRYWWATKDGNPPYHQADDLGAAIAYLAPPGVSIRNGA